MYHGLVQQVHSYSNPKDRGIFQPKYSTPTVITPKYPYNPVVGHRVYDTDPITNREISDKNFVLPRLQLEKLQQDQTDLNTQIFLEALFNQSMSTAAQPRGVQTEQRGVQTETSVQDREMEDLEAEFGEELENLSPLTEVENVPSPDVFYETGDMFFQTREQGTSTDANGVQQITRQQQTSPLTGTPGPSSPTINRLNTLLKEYDVLKEDIGVLENRLIQNQEALKREREKTQVYETVLVKGGEAFQSLRNENEQLWSEGSKAVEELTKRVNDIQEMLRTSNNNLMRKNNEIKKLKGMVQRARRKPSLLPIITKIVDQTSTGTKRRRTMPKTPPSDDEEKDPSYRP
jgi:hypothetical protein